MDGRIFICYRRTDTVWFVTSIYHRLLNDFSKEQIFRDIDSIPYGIDFYEYIDTYVRKCDILLAVIGNDWINATTEYLKGTKVNDIDFVRVEISSAFQNNVFVIPILVDGALMPHAIDLPEDIRKLPRRHAFTISSLRFESDVEKLANFLKSAIKERRDQEQYQRLLEEEIRLKDELEKEIQRQRQIQVEAEEENQKKLKVEIELKKEKDKVSRQQEQMIKEYQEKERKWQEYLQIKQEQIEKQNSNDILKKLQEKISMRQDEILREFEQTHARREAYLMKEDSPEEKMVTDEICLKQQQEKQPKDQENPNLKEEQQIENRGLEEVRLKEEQEKIIKERWEKERKWEEYIHADKTNQRKTNPT